MLGHKIEIEREIYGAGFIAFCECSDADWVDEGWSGQVVFYGSSEQDIIDQHHDHLLEVKEAYV